MSEEKMFEEVCSTNFLEFSFGNRSYSEQIGDAVRKTKNHCAVSVYIKALKDEKTSLSVVWVQHDFGFLGGSLGCAEGEKVTRAFEYATKNKMAIIVACKTGGARMQEGTLSLMQMAKVSVAVESQRRAGLPFISVLEDPTYGGVSASYAMQADVKIASTGARIGFAGPGVILNTMFEMDQAAYDAACPSEFQSAEFCREHGALDLVLQDASQLEATVLGVATALLGGSKSNYVLKLPAVSGYEAPSPEEIAKEPDYTASRAITRPQYADVRDALFSHYLELSGDGQVGSDACIKGGVAFLRSTDTTSHEVFPCIVIGCGKGHTPGEMQAHNYGMPSPAGYRTAKRLMELADRFGLPLITFVDTCGAWPSFPAEETGQSEAIATNLRVMAGLAVPMITMVIGEGGSGGALGLAMGNRLGMLSQAYYGVISPEGAASILGRYSDEKHKLEQFPKDCYALAKAQQIYAYQLRELGVIDEVVYEDPQETSTHFPRTLARLAKFLQDALTELGSLKPEQLVEQRYAKYRALGKFVEMNAEEREASLQKLQAEASTKKARPAKPDITPCPLVKYLATQVLHSERSRYMGLAPAKAATVSPEAPFVDMIETGTDTAKSILDAQGPEAMAKWVRSQDRVLLTDTTMRDAHQSLLATRVRTIDLVKGAKAANTLLRDAFSFECWGGATFDVAYRFLNEDPWDRLRQIRQACPNVCLQMLIRGANAVGYTSYPDNVVVRFVELAAKNGMDIFRIFDCFNDLNQMKTCIEAVRKTGKVAECCVCYTSDITTSTVYDSEYYTNLAKELCAAGAHIIAIKDMAGLMKPSGVTPILKAIRAGAGDDIPIHFHTHCTSSASLAVAIEMTRQGCDIVDFAVAAMADLTSQPSLNAFCAAMAGMPRDPKINYLRLEPLDVYWMKVREMYAPFETGMLAGSARVYDHEIPGGQYANLFVQCKSMGLGERWEEVLDAYRDVNQLFGDIVKVTPSSKCVGDLALFLINKNLKAFDVLDPDKTKNIDYPDSVVGLFEGRLGFPHRGFPDKVTAAILKGKPKLTERPSTALPPADFSKTQAELSTKYGTPLDDERVMSALLYPKVFDDYMQFCATSTAAAAFLPTPIFWYSFAIGQTATISALPAAIAEKEVLQSGDIVLTLKRVGPLKAGRMRTIVFDVNGKEQHVEVKNPAAEGEFDGPMADASNPNHIASPMPGMVDKCHVEEGQTVVAGEELFIVSALKMEVKVRAPHDGKVQKLHVEARDKLVEGALMAIIS